MSEQRVASRYAKSLLDLAEERGALEQVKQDMDLFSKTLDENRDLRLLLRNPIVNHDKKLSILRAVFGGKVSDLTEKFFTIVTQKNRESALEFIGSEFLSQYNALRGVQAAEVTTATPLTPELRTQVQQIVREQTGLQQVTLTEKVDASLIGGFVLRVGDQQIDDSVRYRLRKLRSEFSKNPYQSQL
ncbi:ATP synthase F1 subunit delta [Hymenobacter lutimineralis]|uniref:ATP synthase subunit delta n=1 Tax=Hymenobacter lutimineralis TaxID=2606448 RepID=A0A5D6VB13_9BACT|nr:MULTISPECIES: ATP synthase F1 subunit delta [Hymenobacter]QIX61962.1 ATP synthase F1 subunit delta [Hymenobacter sp. BT18]TYZ12530.1 ATP synthase F1 subunit delta [Hymenobacter lutimineralis]